VHRNLCTRGKLNELYDFGAGFGGLGLSEDDGPAEIELTYSTLRDINRARPAIGMLAVCIIQVPRCAIEPLVYHRCTPCNWSIFM
jgi:hypothetical protein